MTLFIMEGNVQHILNGDSLDAPDFDNASKVHDWRNHVGERVTSLWSTFTAKQRLAIALDAMEKANAEEWD